MLRDPNRQRLVRGTILQALYINAMGADPPVNVQDPYAMPRGVLARVLELSHLLPSRSEMNAAVRYLQQKGYVEAAWDEEGEFTLVRLTGAGMDLVEGTTRDPGVLFPRR
ncbi:hypothetical protein KQ693_10320 [Thermus sp. PS18]|uniref:hypothetical protein n=1 Tax=Thermus sp. PS18 TaxID=2849039 RepID=UPI0022645A77|nr:hypothetical protein [Thermus sp. PS18]UZX15010.1 hypothetical protein KQ693_10320 [Thermus sp. PS18]